MNGSRRANLCTQEATALEVESCELDSQPQRAWVAGDSVNVTLRLLDKWRAIVFLREAYSIVQAASAVLAHRPTPQTGALAAISAAGRTRLLC